MNIQILGAGCSSCKRLKSTVKKAIEELAIPADIVDVTDIEKIMEMGVMITPALAINGVVKSAGKILTIAQVKNLLAKEAQNGS